MTKKKKEENAFGMWQVLRHDTYTVKLNQLLFSYIILLKIQMLSKMIRRNRVALYACSINGGYWAAE